ncbi:MAG: NAD(P)-binding domain-containing protein [Planctomycetes bacterium]|nr:NAD(P)-binding domain-containing protein [Planctomycetota bacterium]
MNRVAVLGSGIVGQTLAGGFLQFGYHVMRASRDPHKLDGWLAEAGDHASTGTFDEAASWGDTIVLAVKGSAAEAAVDLCGPDNLAGKIVIDTTNPIADAPPQNGVLQFFTGPNDSLFERLQARAPRARFVKAFSCVGNAHMVQPDFGGTRPTMFVCGNDDDAKLRVGELLDEFGWDSEDMGGAEAARAIEPLCMLWCIPVFRSGRASHAFKLLDRG